MMNLSQVFKKKLQEIKPSREELEAIDREVEEVMKTIGNSIDKLGIKTELFIGGSLAKKTMVRKLVNDVDLFLRFEKEEDISQFNKIMANSGESHRIIHGSRDYAQIPRKGLIIEVIPVLKIRKPEEARNVTDLSYFHVNYVTGKIKKNKKLVDEIILAKTFSHGAGCYGAESYIRGFSGYGVELLMIHYKSFTKFLKSIIKVKKGEKILLDPEKLYKGKKIMQEVNEAKLSSPIILIDPTYKERNALAALSEETFRKFQEHCRKFLRKPSLKFFEQESIDLERLKKLAQKKKQDFAIIEITTDKQSGDIAGTKLLRFAKLFAEEMKKYYEEPEINFEYDEDQTGTIYFTGKKITKKKLRGPPLDKAEDVKRFKGKYPSPYEEKGRLWVNVELDLTFTDALKNFMEMHGKMMKEMGITSMELKS